MEVPEVIVFITLLTALYRKIRPPPEEGHCVFSNVGKMHRLTHYRQKLLVVFTWTLLRVTLKMMRVKAGPKHMG